MADEQEKRRRVIYATQDGQAAISMDVPFGFIPPPVIELHAPLQGGVSFFSAPEHGITVDPCALQRSKADWAAHA